MTLSLRAPLLLLLALAAPVWSATSANSLDQGEPSPLAEAEALGKNLIENTPAYAQSYVGNSLSCTHCHMDAGSKSGAIPFIGLTGQFPAYSARAGKVITLADRVNGCFVRSMNGTPLPLDSKEMTAILSYISKLSAGQGIGSTYEGRGTPKLDLHGCARRSETACFQPE